MTISSLSPSKRLLTLRSCSENIPQNPTTTHLSPGYVRPLKTRSRISDLAFMIVSFMVSSASQACIQDCMTCDSSPTCIQCDTTFYLYRDSVSARSCVSDITKKGPITDESLAYTMYTDCADPNCSTCTFNYKACSVCESTYLLHPVIISSGLQCYTTAQQGYGKLNGDSTTQAAACQDQNCQLCTGNHSKCSECKSSYLLFDPPVNGAYCLSTIPDGYGSVPSTTNHMNCTDIQCKKCPSDRTACEECKDAFVYLNNSDTTFVCTAKATVLYPIGKDASATGRYRKCTDYCLDCADDYRICKYCNASQSYVSVFVSQGPPVSQCMLESSRLGADKTKGPDFNTQTMKDCDPSLSCGSCFHTFNSCTSCAVSFGLLVNQNVSNQSTYKCEDINTVLLKGLDPTSQNTSLLYNCTDLNCSNCSANISNCTFCRPDVKFLKLNSSKGHCEYVKGIFFPYNGFSSAGRLEPCKISNCLKCMNDSSNCTSCVPPNYFVDYPADATSYSKCLEYPKKVLPIESATFSMVSRVVSILLGNGMSDEVYKQFVDNVRVSVLVNGQVCKNCIDEGKTKFKLAGDRSKIIVDPYAVQSVHKGVLKIDCRRCGFLLSPRRARVLEQLPARAAAKRSLQQETGEENQADKSVPGVLFIEGVIMEKESTMKIFTTVVFIFCLLVKLIHIVVFKGVFSGVDSLQKNSVRLHMVISYMAYLRILPGASMQYPESLFYAFSRNSFFGFINYPSEPTTQDPQFCKMYASTPTSQIACSILDNYFANVIIIFVLIVLCNSIYILSFVCRKWGRKRFGLRDKTILIVKEIDNRFGGKFLVAFGYGCMVELLIYCFINIGYHYNNSKMKAGLAWSIIILILLICLTAGIVANSFYQYASLSSKKNQEAAAAEVSLPKEQPSADQQSPYRQSKSKPVHRSPPLSRRILSEYFSSVSSAYGTSSKSSILHPLLDTTRVWVVSLVSVYMIDSPIALLFILLTLEALHLGCTISIHTLQFDSGALSIKEAVSQASHQLVVVVYILTRIVGLWYKETSVMAGILGVVIVVIIMLFVSGEVIADCVSVCGYVGTVPRFSDVFKLDPGMRKMFSDMDKDRLHGENQGKYLEG